jgi:hypothetical protein
MKQFKQSPQLPCQLVPNNVISLKKPIVTWQGFQIVLIKLMMSKLSCCLVIIHKSNIVTIVSVASRWGCTCK